MSYKPVFRQPEEEIEKSLEKKLNERTKIIEEKTRTDIQNTADDIIKKLEEREIEKIKYIKEEEEQKLKNEQKITEEVEKRIQKLTEESKSSELPEPSYKIAKMIEEIRKRKAVTEDTTSQHQVPNIPLIGPDRIVDLKDSVHCPTCHKGHVHAMKNDGITYKCTGSDCGKEYVMIDKASDYKCAGCGSPIKKPLKDEKLKIDSCPFCHSKKAVKFDWDKLWKIQNLK